MTPSQIRAEIMKVYPGERWRKKVKRMTDIQATAIYLRFKKEGLL